MFDHRSPSGPYGKFAFIIFNMFRNAHIRCLGRKKIGRSVQIFFSILPRQKFNFKVLKIGSMCTWFYFGFIHDIAEYDILNELLNYVFKTNHICRMTTN